MAQRVVEKSLAGRQDILFGKGQVTQTRAGGSYPINKVSVAWACATFEELLTLDTNQFEEATVNYNGAVTHWGWNGINWFCQETGFVLIGQFSQGFTYTAANQVGCTDTDIYSWAGALPKVVAAETNPGTDVNYVSKSAYSLRTALAASNGVDLIGGISHIIAPGSVPKFADTVGVATLLVPDSASARLFLDKTCTNPDDFGVLQIGRYANYTGGTAGYVGAALQVKTTVSASAKKTSEWTALFQLDNSAPNDIAGGGPGSGALPQNVALYGQAQKRGNGATWSLCTEINDHLVGASGAAIGHEIACSANGPDVAIPQRNSSHAAIGKLVSAGMDLEWGRGYWVSTGPQARVRYAFDCTAEVGDTVFHSAASTSQASAALLRDVGSLTMGLDLTGATYSSGMAVRMKVGQKLGFNELNSYYLMGNDSVGGIICVGVFQMQNSFSMSSTGNISTTASAGSRTLPANPSGFINAKLDGVAIRIPYYGA